MMLNLVALASALAATATAADQSLFWGPYRPNLYFGMRPQVPHSLLTGLMWFASDTFEGFPQLRHEANMEDEISKYGWTDYDPHTGGRQVIIDDYQKVNLTIDLVKSDDGLGWEARIRGEQPPEHAQTLVFYTALEGEGDLKLGSKLGRLGIKGDVDFVGTSPELGDFKLSVTKGKGKVPKFNADDLAQFGISGGRPADHAHYFCLNVPDDHAWKAKEIYLTIVQDELKRMVEKFGDDMESLAEFLPVWAGLSLPDTDELGGRFHLVQKTFKGPFEFNLRFNHAEDDFDAAIERVLANQKDRVAGALKLQPPFNTPEHETFAREMLSNLGGGIGYFYGDSLVGDSEGSDSHETAPPHELYTMTPSRSFFPRGFYWDEGFHLLSMHVLDIELCLDIVSSWFEAMNDDGWIAREQILGPEARNRVPAEFRVQYENYANPPTPVMFLAHLGKSAFSNPRVIEQLRVLYPRLQTHFDWFRRSQKGEVVEFDRELPAPKQAYRWRGRTPTHVLTSGMDDYPRSTEPSEGELHVDLLSWVGAMATSLEQIASVLGETEDAAKYAKVRADVGKNLVGVHWSKEHEAFCDISLDEFEEDVHVCHTGYVTHLPFMLKLIDPSAEDQLLAVMAQLRDPAQLWSVGGIRSLSKSDDFFGSGENYWRGPVWVQMNFLVLDALEFYATSPKSSAEVKRRAADMYAELRVLVAGNVYERWLETGYVWEQYDGETGAAKGARQFTGWTALAANIMAMPEQVSSRTHVDQAPEGVVDESVVDQAHEDL